MIPEPQYPHMDILDGARAIQQSYEEKAAAVEESDPAKAETYRRLSIKAVLDAEEERSRLLERERQG